MSDRRVTKGRVIRMAYITRDLVRSKPDALFVFGDNMARRGYGGQAAVMRGEPNAIGVPTKWLPARMPEAYFTDADLPQVRGRIETAFSEMHAALLAARDVVIPSDGLGTGLAELPTRAPAIHALIEARIAELDDV